MDSTHDLVVVGGGPAGLAAAQQAATAGLRVVVLERNAAFGEPVRTSGGSFTAPLRELGVPERLWQPVSRLRLIGPRHDLVFDYPDDPMCVLDVRGLYQWMAAQAALDGARLSLRSRVTGPVVEGGRVVGVQVRGGGTLRARLVLDASGAGVLARALGLRAEPPRQALGLEQEVLAPRYDQREALLVVGDAVAPGGYGWAFPCGGQRVRLGVGVVRPDSTADIETLLRALVDRVPSLQASCADTQPLEVHAGVMPAFAHGAVPLLHPGLLVAGDAAGQGSTLVGEGIRHAITAGRLAGSAVVEALRSSGTVDDAALRRYPQQWHRAVGWQMRTGFRVHRRVCRYRDEQWSAALDVVEQLHPQAVLAAVAGELTPGWAVRLAARQPRLALGAGRRFVSAGLRSSG